MTFADGSCEGRSRSEEEVMQGHRRRRATQRSPATPISPMGGGGTASISLSLLLRDAHDIALSLLRELNAVALATNVMVFLGRDTQPAFLTLDRREVVEMAVDTRRATRARVPRGPRKRTLCSTLRRPTEQNAVDAARSADGVDRV